MATEIYDPVKLIAKADIQCRNACDRGRCGVEDGRIRVPIEGVVSTRVLVQVEDMKAVLATGAHFHAIELYGIVSVQMEIEALEKEGGVHAIWGRDGTGHGLVVPILKAKDARGTADKEYGTGGAVNRIGVGRILELEGEGGGPCGGYRHLFRNAAIAYCVRIRDSWNRIECPLEFRAQFCGRVLAGCQGCHIVCIRFFEGKDVPAGVDIVEIRGNTAVDEFHGEDVLERAAEGPAKRIGRIVGHKVTVAAIHGDSHGALFSVFTGRVRE